MTKSVGRTRKFSRLAHCVVDRFCTPRKYWEEESGKKGDRFSVEDMVGTHAGSDHEMLVKRSIVMYDTLFGNSKPVYIVLVQPLTSVCCIPCDGRL